MNIRLKCPKCRAPLVAPPEMAGRKAKCRQCAAIVLVPDPQRDRWPPGMAPPGPGAQSTSSAEPRPKAAASQPPEASTTRPVRLSKPASAKAAAEIPKAVSATTPTMPQAKKVPQQPADVVGPDESDPATVPTVTPQAAFGQMDDLTDLLDFETSVPPVQRPAAQASRVTDEQTRRSSQRDAEPLRVGVVLRRSWEVYKANLGVCIGTFFVAGALFFGLNLIVVAASQAYGALADGTILGLGRLAFSPLFIVIPAWLGAGVCQFALNVASGKKGRSSDLLEARQFLLPMLVLMFVLLALVGLSVLFGFLLSIWFALPVLLPSILLMQTPFVAIHQRLGPIRSLVESARLTVANFLPLCLIWSTMFVILCVTVLSSCGFASIASGPFLAVLSAVTYLEMAPQTAEA